MIVLPTFDFPQLEDGHEPLTLRQQQQQPPRGELVNLVHVLPFGLAMQQRALLTARLLMEERQKPSRRHEDPNAAGASDGEDDSEGDGDGSGEYGRGGGGSFQQQQSYASRRKKFVKLTEEDLQVDWYEILGLEQSGGATDEQIRTAYRRRCLETHPDKQKDRSDAAFKKVQRALDILGDPETRLTYDSSCPFDDTIPAETLPTGADFYAIFGPVFERNKRWSTDPSLPSIGNDKTSLEEVNRFYDRWVRFQSWRDFSHMVELDEIDDSMCREEKRYYMRENERQLNCLRREEQQRLRTLVERARKNDPRLRRKREEDEAKRQREQKEREDRRRQAREEGERRRAEEMERERQKREEEKRKITDTKNAIRQAKDDLIVFLEEHGLLDETATNKLLRHAVRRPNIGWIFSKINTAEEAAGVVSEVKNKDTTRRATSTKSGTSSNVASRTTDESEEDTEVEAVICFNELVEEKERQIGLTRYGEAVKARPEPKPQEAKKKTVPESVNKHAKEWDEEDLTRLQKATAKFPPGTVERWSKIAEQLRGKFTEEEAMQKVNEITAGLHRSGGQTGVASAKQPTSAVEGSGATAAAAPSAGGANSQVASVEDWTVKQQKMLELGLRDLKDYKEKDKFQKIAAMVDGKNARECFERFKYLCAMNKRK
ncbi:chaperone protein DNAj [Trypanosoma brucei equiperdum]|uniref:Chaperone protein DNAj n=1 Tax=Trypanosoma brucei equiperdum TaxID=630700 RepID=A0A3L6LHP1_9TRYP|nr:chaperone protein DNAj [Trypanosoma brucei equiperdum]